MSLFVDTSAWSLALRRDAPPEQPEVIALARALEAGEPIYSTGLVLQELLQGFTGPKAPEAILERFSALPLVTPERQDHIKAAELRNACRRSGIQIGTVDALIAQICIRHSFTLLTCDKDFHAVAKQFSLRVWSEK